MTIVPSKPIASLHGKVLGDNHGYHVRTNSRGVIYTARSGNPQQHPSAAQLCQQDRFRFINTEVHRILHDPALRSAYEKAYSHQSKCHRLCDFIRSEVYQSL